MSRSISLKRKEKLRGFSELFKLTELLSGRTWPQVRYPSKILVRYP